MSGGLAMLPWYPGDFMKSTRGSPVTAKGVYRELLDAQWDIGGLPAAVDELRALIHATDVEWSIGWPRCEAKFPIDDDDGLRRNRRLEEHRIEAEERRRLARKHGQAGAKGRWKNRRRGGDARALPEHSAGTAQARPEECPPSPSPTPSPSPSLSPSRERVSGKRAREHSPEFQRIRNRFPEIRRKGQPDWDLAEQHATQLVETGVATWDELAAGVERYRSFVERGGFDVGCEYAPTTFFEPAQLAEDRSVWMWVQPWK